MTRSTATGRFVAPSDGGQQPAARRSSGRTGLPGSVSSLTRLGLATVLGTALVAAGQLPAGAVQAPVAPARTVQAAAATPAAAAAPTTKAAAPLTAAQRRVKAVKVAKKLVGTPYRYGGTTKRGFDCSGYTQYVWKKAGKKLPRTSRAQRSHVKKVSRANARKGDLVFFHSSSGRVYHVGIYAGKGRLLDSPKPGKRVSLRKIWSSNVTFGRV